MSLPSHIYFDNAASTPLHSEVLEVMMPYLTSTFGNPSSIHAHGREARAAVEKARKSIAGLLNTSPSQIFFTSGGTESDNTVIRGAIDHYNIKDVITSPLEHHAVLHTLEHLKLKNKINLHYLKLNTEGVINAENLKELLDSLLQPMVSLMHGNNEIGNLININDISELCNEHNAFFHSDTVQTVGHYLFDLKTMKVDSIVASAHKFHGPKGIGFYYLGEGHVIDSLVYGGAQERNMRGGTENIAGIVGMSKAIELAYANLQTDRDYILSLKKLMKELLIENIGEVQFNGLSGDLDKSLYTVLSVLFPKTEMAEMLLFNMDINKISVSGGSACTSGSAIGSHVLKVLYGNEDDRPTIRFSFSKFNTSEEIRYTVEVLKKIFTN